MPPLLRCPFGSRSFGISWAPVIALIPTGTGLGVTDQRHMTNCSAADLGYPPISRVHYGSPAETRFSTFSFDTGYPM